MKLRPILHALLFLSACPLPVQALTLMYWEEQHYYGRSDSPFYEGIQAGTIVVEDFEDGKLNTPHVVSWDYPLVQRVENGITYPSRQIGMPSNPGNPNSTYSVDEDDGQLGDFLGKKGNTWTTMDVATGQRFGRIEFRFERDEQGRLPTYVGFVITEVLDVDEDVSIGMQTPGIIGNIYPGEEYNPKNWIPDEFPGDTRGHRFFGLYCDTGIEILVVNNTSQLDHLQYGYAIPEPAPLSLAALALAAAAGHHRRRSRLSGHAKDRRIQP